MNKTKLEWALNPDGTQQYIAGFFDGEGSAMILTIRRNLQTGVIYRFRPIIKIQQKNPEILYAIKSNLGYGHIDTSKDGFAYIINGLDSVRRFFQDVGYYARVKHDALLGVGALAHFQKRHKRKNIPYTKKDTETMLCIRNKVFKANSVTRNGLKQKYSAKQILSETTFVKDIEAWKKHRSRGILKSE